MSGSDRPALHLVSRGMDEYRIGAVRLSIFSPHSALPCDAVVIEEDSWQILAAGVGFTPCREHPIRIWTELLETKPLSGGTVLAREGWPLTLRAVVYDFESEPCCRPRWIAAALREIFRICRERRVRSLLLPLPGVRHGRLSLHHSLRLVMRALYHEAAGGLQRVLVVCSSPEEAAAVGPLLPLETELWSRPRK